MSSRRGGGNGGLPPAPPGGGPHGPGGGPGGHPGGLHLPIASMASLHLSGNNPIDNNGRKPAIVTTTQQPVTSAFHIPGSNNLPGCNNNMPPYPPSTSGHQPPKLKKAGFSLPLSVPNSLLPSSSVSIIAKTEKSAVSAQQSAVVSSTAELTAQSKRCRFAVKDNGAASAPAGVMTTAAMSAVATAAPSFHTSTSSNASTVIEQPQSKLRKSRSPSRKQQHVHAVSTENNGMPISAYHRPNRHADGVEFRAPLMIEQAEELMLMAKQGKTHNMGLRVIDTMPHHPRGGTMFLVHTATFNR